MLPFILGHYFISFEIILFLKVLNFKRTTPHKANSNMDIFLVYEMSYMHNKLTKMNHTKRNDLCMRGLL